MLTATSENRTRRRQPAKGLATRKGSGCRVTVLEKRHGDTPSTLVRAEPADELLAAFLAGRSDCTRRAYSQDLDDFRRFLGVGKVSDAATTLLSRGHGEANKVAFAWKASLQERRL